MARPHKSTLDALVDAFAEFHIEAQDKALELMQFENRRAKIRAKKESVELITRHITLSFLNSLPLDIQNAIWLIKSDIGAGFGVIQLSRGLNETLHRYRMDANGRAVLSQGSPDGETPQAETQPVQPAAGGVE